MKEQGWPENRRLQNSYFVPMVDMLAGVIFLLVIMLAASVLVSRGDFGQTQMMQQEISSIEQKLAAARAEEVLYLDPRRKALAATGILLLRLQGALAKQGLAVEVDATKGVLSVEEDFHPFSTGSSSVSGDGSCLASALAGSLLREFPCLAANDNQSAYCQPYQGVRLETIEIDAPFRGGAGVSAARGIAFTSAVASIAPELLTFVSEKNVGLISFAPADQSVEGAESQQQSELSIRVQMSLPSGQ